MRSNDPIVVESIRPASPAHKSDNHTFPLPKSPNRWIAPSLDSHGRTELTAFSPTQAKRRFTGLFNKVTRKNFYFISDRIFAWIGECDQEVRGKVLELACRQLFDRAVDEPEKMGLYAAVCNTMCGMVKMQKNRAQGTSDHDLIRNCMVQYWYEAFQQGNISWGSPVRGSIMAAIPTRVGEQYYITEKQKRRGIGLAGLAVELSILGLFELLGKNKCNLFQELARNLRNNPTEGDVVSLCILLRNVTAKFPKEVDLATIRNLAGSSWGDNGISPRLRCQLLVSRRLIRKES